jgi:hypothetical protein
MWTLLTELVLVMAAMVIVHGAPGLSRHSWIHRSNQFVRHLAAKKAVAVFVVFALSLTIRLAILPFVPVPTPQNHDEFSNLLAADTFASGRLTNRTHPFWQHFETFHIEHQPTYMSMYPPGSGLLLAVGQRTLGVPWVGVLIATAAMCASITWMLQAWLPPYWAFLGGLLALMRIGLFSYWVNSFWGGSLPALAGAIFVGALTRLCKKPSALHGILLALSVGVLANTRMYEGALLVGTAVLSMAIHGRMRNIRLPIRTVVPATIILVGIAAAMLYYNRTVYGNALTLPYSINRHTYAAAQLFLWQKPNPVPVFRHAPMREFFVGLELDRFERFRTPYGFAAGSVRKAVLFYLFFVGPLLTIPLLCIRFRDRRVIPLTSIGMLMVPGVLSGAWFAPHYISPATCIIYAILLQSMRRLSAFTIDGKRAGRSFPVMLVIMSAVMTLIICVATWSRTPINAPPLSWCGWTYRGSDRGDLVESLSAQPGQHLVIVRYEPTHSPSKEYVYNRADIDGSHIVWAREMDPPSNELLRTYFKNRRVWLFEPDLMPAKLTRLR